MGAPCSFLQRVVTDHVDAWAEHSSLLVRKCSNAQGTPWCTLCALTQASAEFPENTLRSFEQAIKDGSEGIESDVHITADDVIVMFHDTTLDRTTNGKGLITARNYFGADGLEHVRTLKEPVQQIPTFKELCTLLMEPENRHVSLNVDIKPNNDPERLFRIMGEVVHQFPNYENDLAPRLILGLWHPKFIQPAKHHVPTLRRAHIGASPADAVKYFWNDCDAFSIRFPSLVGAEGQAFLRKAREANKDVMVWTVNRKDEMVEAARYGVKAILTDYTADLHKLRDEMKGTSAYSPSRLRRGPPPERQSLVLLGITALLRTRRVHVPARLPLRGRAPRRRVVRRRAPGIST